jgi:hypothetical protein
MHDETFGSSAPQIDPEQGHWWIAYHNTTLAGFCGLTELPEEPDCRYLKRAATLLGHRGHGLQRRMIRVREALGRRLGIKTLVTDTTDNIPSANNLMRAGYRLYKPQTPWGFNHSLYWFKSL